MKKATKKEFYIKAIYPLTWFHAVLLLHWLAPQVRWTERPTARPWGEYDVAWRPPLYSCPATTDNLSQPEAPVPTTCKNNHWQSAFKWSQASENTCLHLNKLLLACDFDNKITSLYIKHLHHWHCETPPCVTERVTPPQGFWTVHIAQRDDHWKRGREIFTQIHLDKSKYSNETMYFIKVTCVQSQKTCHDLLNQKQPIGQFTKPLRAILWAAYINHWLALITNSWHLNRENDI